MEDEEGAESAEKDLSVRGRAWNHSTLRICEEREKNYFTSELYQVITITTLNGIYNTLNLYNVSFFISEKHYPEV